jgi:hypothetical protein
VRWMLLALLTTATTTAHSAGVSDASPAQPEPIASAFLEHVGKGEVDGAMGSLPLCAALAAKTQQLTLLKGQINTSLSLYGGYLGIEKVRMTEYSPSLLRVVYIMKREQGFLVWNFYFYRATDRWEVTALFFSDQPTGLD